MYYYGSKQAMHTKSIWWAIALANILQHLGYTALPQPSINISVHVCAIYVLRVVAFCSMLRHISIWNMPLCALSCKLHYYYYYYYQQQIVHLDSIHFVLIFLLQGGFFSRKVSELIGSKSYFQLCTEKLKLCTSFRSYFVHLLYLYTSCTIQL